MALTDNNEIFSRYDKAQRSKLLREHDETDMSNPEERHEVRIGKRILDLCRNSDHAGSISEIKKLAQELVNMHSKPGAEGPVSIKHM